MGTAHQLPELCTLLTLVKHFLNSKLNLLSLNQVAFNLYSKVSIDTFLTLLLPTPHSPFPIPTPLKVTGAQAATCLDPVDDIASDHGVD